MKEILFALVCIVFLGCTMTDSKKKIVGYYEIDKNIIKDTTKRILTHKFLNLKDNHTFQLSNADNKNIVIGNWEIAKSKGNEETNIEFSFNGKKIQATLNGTIFSFEYPNDFYLGFYEKVLFVKLSSVPKELVKE